MNTIIHKLYQIKKKVDTYWEINFLDFIYHKYIERNPRAREIMDFKIEDYTKKLLGERDFPSNEKFIKNGWYKTMLLRYGFAMHYSRGRKVLESCSGLGWGAYLIDGVAKSVTCVELDWKCIEFSNKNWKTNRTKYIMGNVLSLPAKDESFDTVISMESIEHFALKDLKIYLGELFRILKGGGFLVGSSAFPETRKEADELCAKNKYHLYICTKNEIKDILEEKDFKKIYIFRNGIFFFAQK